MTSTISALLKWVPKKSAGTIISKKIAEGILRPFVYQDYEAIDYKKKDWDNLIILDACRFDDFRRLNTLEGKPEKVHSNATHTWEFLKNNFSGENLDTVYVTANPQMSLLENELAHQEDVWIDGWDDELNTVPPEKVTEKALELSEKYPEKRMVVHYMQPHYPFIGPSGKEISGKGSYRFLDGKTRKEEKNVWERLYSGEIELENVRKGYRENLKTVLPEVRKLSGRMKGKTVVSSDHGNLFGKKPVPYIPLKVYGHPINFPDRELTSVPWLELPYSERKNIKKADEQDRDQEKRTEKVKERLRELGYFG